MHHENSYPQLWQGIARIRDEHTGTENTVIRGRPIHRAST